MGVVRLLHDHLPQIQRGHRGLLPVLLMMLLLLLLLLLEVMEVEVLLLIRVEMVKAAASEDVVRRAKVERLARLQLERLVSDDLGGGGGSGGVVRALVGSFPLCQG
jgi:hypothetical protein